METSDREVDEIFDFIDMDRSGSIDATVLQKVTEESSVSNEVPIWRAVGTLTSGVENYIVEKFVGSAAKAMKEWQVFLQVVWQSQV